MSSEWKEFTLDEFLTINPRESIKKGALAKKVPMDILGEFKRNISDFSEEEFKGGTKFRNGDTLLARITPCLQNGKTAFVDILEDDEVGFGSTEYIVLREKENISDAKFIFYLSISPQLRNISIQSMTGSSGRQRVQTDVLKNHVFNLPPIQEQKRIAHILGTLDDKIELNRKMNETLEAMAEALFKSWFVDFDPVIDNALAAGNPIPEPLQKKAEARQAFKKSVTLSGDEGHHHLFPSSFTFNETLNKWIPKGWEATNLKECLDTISKTYNLKEKEEIIFLNTGDIEEGKFLHNDLSEVKGLPGQAKKSIQKGDILYSEIRPKNKRFAFVYFDSSEYVVSTKLMVLRPKNEIDSLFYYQILKTESTITELQFLAESRSGTFPQITFDTLSAIEFSLPNEPKIIEEYVKQLKEIFNKSIQNLESIESLEKVRDSLLPKLISGKIKV